MRYGQFKLSEDEIQSLRPVVGNQKDAGDYVDIIQDKAEEAPQDVQKKILNGLEQINNYIKQKIEEDQLILYPNLKFLLFIKEKN